MTAMIQCPACKKDISSAANVCPNCGHPIDDKTRNEAIEKMNAEKIAKKTHESKSKKRKALFATIFMCLFMFAVYSGKEDSVPSKCLAMVESEAKNYIGTGIRELDWIDHLTKNKRWHLMRDDAETKNKWGAREDEKYWGGDELVATQKDGTRVILGYLCYVDKKGNIRVEVKRSANNRLDNKFQQHEKYFDMKTGKEK